MNKGSKYFFIRNTGIKQVHELAKWNERYYVLVDENIEYYQCIFLEIDTTSGSIYPKPKSSEYQKVKPILKELFDDYYSQSLVYIGNIDIDDGEFYIINHKNNCFEIEYYSNNEKQRRNITIDFRYFIDNLDLTISTSGGWARRPHTRKSGIPITKEHFKQFLSLTLKYLSDSDSYTVYLDVFLKNFQSLAKGDQSVDSFDVSAEKSFKNIMEQLIQRKEAIEKQLIENDSYSIEDRIKLRGEIEGINYAISTINTFK